MKYVAVIFDIVESRTYKNRYQVQRILTESICYLNDLYRHAIKKEVVSSAGDEFQGLFKDLQTAFLYVRKLQLLIYPIEVQCGIGYGTIKYDEDKWTSSAIDGEAYYLCRDAINAIPKGKGNVILFNTTSRFDRYLNVLCISGNEIKLKQSRMVRFIELIADMVLPIYTDESVNINADFYNYIFENRIDLIEQENRNKGIGKYRGAEYTDIDFNQVFYAKQRIENRKCVDDVFYLEDFWAHGMSTSIAQIVNTTRQNIDRYVLSGKIKESRTIDKAIFELLGENIW